jgi:hypothetical protein
MKWTSLKAMAIVAAILIAFSAALVGTALALWSKPEEVEIKTISPTVVGSGWTF